jgi:hypothetical protein
MVKAIQAGTKTQTRRIIKNVGIGTVSRKPKLVPEYIGRFVNSAGSDLWAPFGSGQERPDGAQNTVNTMRSGWFPCPYGQPGDRLKVGEAWRTLKEYDDLSPAQLLDHAPISFEADGVTLNGHWGQYRNARFLPMRFRRLELEVVAVRVERLQAISTADSVAEGIEVVYRDGPDVFYKRYSQPGKWHKQLMPTQSYRTLWESINGPDCWEANPWVWVVEFQVVQPK